jgi:RNA polymerase sigma-70 factor (ECF subfamily)
MEATLARPSLVARRPRDETNPVDRWAGSTEGSLVDASLRGRPEAYGELVRRHQVAVYNVAYRLVGERQVALDVTQDAFVRAYQSLGTFKPDRPFGPWIKRIATNVALDWLGRRASTVPLPPRPRAEGTSAVEETRADESAEPEHRYLEWEERDRIRRAILALPPRYRAVVELRHFQDLAYDEIAATLGIPLSDVKSHLFRARRLLRERLGPDR